MAGPFILDPKTGKLVPNPDYTPGTRDDQTGQVALGKDGFWHYLTYGPNGEERLSAAHAPRPASDLPQNPNPGHTTSSSTSSSTSQSFQDPAYLAIESTRVQNEIKKTQQDYDLAVKSGDRQAQQYAQTRLDDLSKYGQTLQYNYAQLTQNASEGALNRQQTTSERTGTEAFTAGQSATGRAFTAREDLMSRAQKAGEFAATYALDKQRAQRQQLADQMQAAKTYSELSGAPDLTGYARFQQAGGGVLGNSIAAGATSLTPQGQLGAARALQAARAPQANIPDYVNPYAGVDLASPWAEPGMGGASQQPMSAAEAMALQQRRLAANPLSNADANRLLTGNPNAEHTTWMANEPAGSVAPITSPSAFNAAGGIDTSGLTAAGYTAAPPGHAYGTAGPTIMRREPVTAMPMGASMDQVTDRFATGTRWPAQSFYGRSRYAEGTDDQEQQGPSDPYDLGSLIRAAGDAIGGVLGGIGYHGEAGAPSEGLRWRTERRAQEGLPAYARGTLGRRPQLGTVHVDPNGGGYPPGYAEGTQRYATGDFITGDSTDPDNPAAGGAHPEEVKLDDPPGADNARAQVIPLTTPGVGDTGDKTNAQPDEGEDPDRIAALLRAIADFLDPDAGEGSSAPSSPSPALGGAQPMLGRFAGGTDATGLLPADQPSVDEVMQTRGATPYAGNPYAYNFDQQSPTQRAIDAQSLQTRFGVPAADYAFEAARFRPGGLARNSTYARELDIGL